MWWLLWCWWWCWCWCWCYHPPASCAKNTCFSWRESNRQVAARAVIIAGLLPLKSPQNLGGSFQNIQLPACASIVIATSFRHHLFAKEGSSWFQWGDILSFPPCVIVINRCNAKRNNCNAFSLSSSDFASSASIVAVKTPTYGLPLPATPSGVSGWLRSRGRRRWCHLGLHASLVPEMQRPADPWKQFQGVSRRSTHISEGFITV